MITDEQKLHNEINRLSGKKNWPFLEEGQLELARCAKKYARDIPHLSAAITKLSESLDHCPDARELRVELVGDVKPIEVQRCIECGDNGTVFRIGIYLRCWCRFGKMIHQDVLNELNNPPALLVDVPDEKTAVARAATATALENPVTWADVEREARRAQNMRMAAEARRVAELQERQSDV